MKREEMPQFCKKCVYLRTSIFSSGQYCSQICKYNPKFQFAASHSCFYRKSGAGVA